MFLKDESEFFDLAWDLLFQRLRRQWLLEIHATLLLKVDAAAREDAQGPGLLLEQPAAVALENFQERLDEQM